MFSPVASILSKSKYTTETSDVMILVADTYTSERPGNRDSVLLCFEHHCLYAMHRNATFSNDALVGWYVVWPHWELQKRIVSPLNSMF